jgi:cytochrome d ubiquinol oxidase subunit II
VDLWDGNEVWLIVRGVAFENRGKRDRERWRRTWDTLLTAGSVLAPLVIGIALGDLLHWTHVTASTAFFLNPVELLAVLAAIAAVWLVYDRRDGFAFAATTVTMAACIVSIFTGLYPNVMVSSTSKAYNLTVYNTASGPYSLKILTIVVIIFLPAVLAYQVWTYYIFRRRVSADDFRPASPGDGDSLRRDLHV